MRTMNNGTLIVKIDSNGRLAGYRLAPTARFSFLPLATELASGPDDTPTVREYTPREEPAA